MCPQRSDALIKDQATAPHNKNITSSTLDTFTWILKVTSSSICLTQNLPILVSHPPITTCVHLGPPSVLISMPGTSINPRYQHRYFPVSHHPEPIHHKSCLFYFLAIPQICQNPCISTITTQFKLLSSLAWTYNSLLMDIPWQLLSP